jgi:hypothetical protein
MTSRLVQSNFEFNDIIDDQILKIRVLKKVCEINFVSATIALESRNHLRSVKFLEWSSPTKVTYFSSCR